MAFGTANNKARQLVAQWVTSKVDDELGNKSKMKYLKRMESILPARSHNQAIEQGVQLISHCLGNGRSEAVDEHQKVTHRHNEALKTEEICPNQHISGGTKDSGNCVAKSEEAKRLEAERNELGQEYITKSQASKQKAKYFIKLCEEESYANIPKEAMKKIDKRAREKKTNKELANKEIRIQQKIEELTTSIERNEHLKVANGQAKPRRKEDIKPATIEKPVNQTGLFKVTNFSRRVQMKYIVEEIICLCIENRSLVSDDEIKAEKE